MSISSSKQQVNLDDLISQFTEWQEVNASVQRDNIYLQDQIKEHKRLLAEADTATKQLRHRLDEQINLTTIIQDTLKKKCDIEDENRLLKAQIEKDKETFKQKLQEHKKQIEDLHLTISCMTTEHQAQLNEQEKQLGQTAKAELRKMAEKLENQQLITQQLREQLDTRQKEHQAEVVRLRFEYENKLVKMQKQNTKMQSSHGAAVGQDIFRKKLAHMRAESEQEIQALKLNIGELEEKLAKQQQLHQQQEKQQQQQQQRPRDSLSVTRSRRFYHTARSRESI